jgi:hypothetical protein
MPKATKPSDSATTKRPSRKTKPNGNGTKAAEQVTASPKFVHETQSSPVLEEKIRTRAYELYLQRGGTGGSPEQDWLQAKEEICGQQRIA